MSFWGRVGTAFATGGLSELGGLRPIAEKVAPDAYNTVFGDPGADQERQRKTLLYQQAQAAGGAADQAQGNYQQLGQQGNGALAALQRQAQGQDSISAEQLRQGLAQSLAQQRSLAAGASPRNAAMAARTAAIQSGRAASGLAGQQALAGLQERAQAQQQYGTLLGNLRGQDASMALGSRQAAIGGYGAGQAGAPEKSWLEKYGPAIQGGISSAAMSDIRAKTNIRPADDAALAALSRVPAIQYTYRDPARHGQGVQLGVPAQALERVGLGQAVVDTPRGKAIDAGKLTGANTAAIAALSRQVLQLQRDQTPRVPATPPLPGVDDAAYQAQVALDRRRAQLAGRPYYRPVQYTPPPVAGARPWYAGLADANTGTGLEDAGGQ